MAGVEDLLLAALTATIARLEAAMEERSRVAREFHDALGHSLAGIALQLASADALHVDGRNEEANRAVRRARALAVGSLAETERTMQSLRPTPHRPQRTDRSDRP